MRMSLDPQEFNRIMEYKSAKHIWDPLKETHGSSSGVDLKVGDEEMDQEKEITNMALMEKTDSNYKEEVLR